MSSLLAIIWGILLCGAPCGCVATNKTISFLMAGVILSCFLALIVWAMGAIALIIGAHGKGLLCAPLYDYPNFQVLGILLNAHGFLYEKGAFQEFGAKDDTLRVSEVLK